MQQGHQNATTRCANRVANGDGAEVTLTLFRLPSMDDAAFEADAAAVEKDLGALKTLLETRRRK